MGHSPINVDLNYIMKLNWKLYFQIDWCYAAPTTLHLRNNWILFFPILNVCKYFCTAYVS